MKMNIVNPATGAVIAAVEQDDQQSLDSKYNTLKEGQKAWAAIPLQNRIDILQTYSKLLAENIEPLAKTLTDEVGKPLQQSRNEINGSISRITWLTQNAEKYLADEIMNAAAGMTELIRYEPLGVVCNISAWNYPYLVGTNVFVPALLAGNAVFYKPSEFATLTGLHIERLLKEAGVPANVFQVAIGGASAGEILLNLPLDGYFFTGSYKTGKYIYEKVAPKMVPCQCELGGKDPLYVTDDVEDIAGVAAGTADGAFYNNGQSCCAVERIYVHEKVHTAYVDAFVKEVASWKIGNPMEEGVYIGAISRQSQLAFLEHQVADAIAKGATLLTGGKRIEGDGYFFEPTVLTNVDHSMLVMQEESFGPIIGIMKVNNDEEALQLMNDTSYGLTASVYSKNRERAEKLLAATDAGTGYWNCCDRVSAALPWSGRNHSGFGATLSHAGIRAFTQPKAFHLRG
jgi:acyl-CoA reductase-like NAD-dependent aldehyde dehydrogenase